MVTFYMFLYINIEAGNYYKNIIDLVYIVINDDDYVLPNWLHDVCGFCENL